MARAHAAKCIVAVAIQASAYCSSVVQGRIIADFISSYLFLSKGMVFKNLAKMKHGVNFEKWTMDCMEYNISVMEFLQASLRSSTTSTSLLRQPEIYLLHC